MFEPAWLEGIIHQLRQEAHRERGLFRIKAGSKAGELPDRLIERLIAVDASILSALPQLVGRLRDRQKGQWRLHAHVRVWDNTLVASALTEEPSAIGHGERDVLAEMIAAKAKGLSESESGHLYLMDRGYRSAELFNRIHAAGHDYVCHLNRNDGRV